MEKQSAHEKKVYVFFYEALGTAMLVWTYNLAKFAEFAEFSIGFLMMPLLILGATVSGAHFNPAVTIGVYLA